MARAARERAAQRRINLCTRGTLDGLARLAMCLGSLSRRARSRIDPAGGAYAPTS